jgi:hypothetical protein
MRPAFLMRVGGRSAVAEFARDMHVSNRTGILINSIILYQVFLKKTWKLLINPGLSGKLV